jgi:hypothetical protein
MVASKEAKKVVLLVVLKVASWVALSVASLVVLLAGL